MVEMQAIQNMHCTLWTEGVREIVSAKDSEVKFIISDHPVTVYNYACPPDSEQCTYPNDPDIALKASQTLYPLDRDNVLILTNLEYAQNPNDCNPLEQRTHSQKVRKSYVRTDSFIRSRELNAGEVTKINHIVKNRANKFIAAGKNEWLYPEKQVECNWDELRDVLLPPANQIDHFGGELFVGFEDGSSHYQDAYGRSTPQHDYLNKQINESNIGRNEPCGCGSGKKYKKCCKDVPIKQRTTWKVKSIRERNLFLYNAIHEILGLNDGKSWEDVRREISDDQIQRIYRIYGLLWPVETDIYELLPKPDGKIRGLYTGLIDPRTIGRCALSMTPYFDELLIQHPFVNPNNVNPEFSPVESPKRYKSQILKDIMFLLVLEPFVGSGLVNLIPDLCWFDNHLQRQMLDMATKRRGHNNISEQDKEIFINLNKDSIFHTITSLPDHMKDDQIRKIMPDLNDGEIEHLKQYMAAKALEDPLALLQEYQFDKDGQLMMFSMSPNYEMALFTAQATGSVIVTDSGTRWNEFQQAQHRELGMVTYPWQQLSASIRDIVLCIIYDDILNSYSISEFRALRRVLAELNDMVRGDCEEVDKIAILEKNLINCVGNIFKFYDGSQVHPAKMHVLIPKYGFVDKYVQRLLLKSNCQVHLNSVSMVIYIGHD